MTASFVKNPPIIKRFKNKGSRFITNKIIIIAKIIDKIISFLLITYNIQLLNKDVNG